MMTFSLTVLEYLGFFVLALFLPFVWAAKALRRLLKHADAWCEVHYHHLISSVVIGALVGGVAVLIFVLIYFLGLLA